MVTQYMEEHKDANHGFHIKRYAAAHVEKGGVRLAPPVRFKVVLKLLR